MDNKNTKLTSLKELAVMAYNLPVNNEIGFSCDEDANFWAIRKINIFDGNILLVGSFGGGLTCSLDLQIDGGSDEIETFLTNVLQDHAANEVYVEQEIKSTYWSRIESIRKELRDEIKMIMQDNNLSEVDFTNSEGDAIYVVWFDHDGDPYDTPVIKVVVSKDGTLSLDVATENVDLEDIKEGEKIATTNVNIYELGLRNIDWLYEILLKVKTETAKTE